MKKLLVSVLFCIGLYAADASVYMGQTYYAFFLAPEFGVGSEFTKQFTKKRWQELFANEAREFYKEFDIKLDTFDAQQLKHLEAFMKYYAKDSEAVPVCN